MLVNVIGGPTWAESLPPSKGEIVARPAQRQSDGTGTTVGAYYGVLNTATMQWTDPSGGPYRWWLPTEFGPVPYFVNERLWTASGQLIEQDYMLTPVIGSGGGIVDYRATFNTQALVPTSNFLILLRELNLARDQAGTDHAAFLQNQAVVLSTLRNMEAEQRETQRTALEARTAAESARNTADALTRLDSLNAAYSAMLLAATAMQAAEGWSVTLSRQGDAYDVASVSSAAPLRLVPKTGGAYDLVVDDAYFDVTTAPSGAVTITRKGVTA